MTDTLKAIRIDRKIWDEFKSLADEEGRNHGKLLEVLLRTYKEVNIVSTDKTDS